MLTPKEYHFMALSTEIEVQTLTDIPELNLISNFHGPLQQNTISKIPLFVALELQSKQYVKILIPYYLSHDFIINALEKEKEDVDAFQKVHPHFFELLHIMKDTIRADNPSTSNLANELREVRLGKLKVGMSGMDGKAVVLDNLTQYEFSHINLYVKETMEGLIWMEKPRRGA